MTETGAEVLRLYSGIVAAAQAAAAEGPAKVLVSENTAAAVGDAGLQRLAQDGAPTYALTVR